jgi:pilus assembly protein CpaB
VTSVRGPLGRLSNGHWVMLVAGVVAVVLNFAFLRSQQHMVTVAVAAADLQAGSLLDISQVAFTAIHAETSIENGLLSRTDLEDGLVLARSVPAGALISKADILMGESGVRAMSIPVDREHAVGGLLRRGDRVDVVASDSGTSRYVLVDAEVLSVSDASGALGSDYSVTVALDGDSALRVAAALSNETLEVVRSTGAPPPGSLTYPNEP